MSWWLNLMQITRVYPLVEDYRKFLSFIWVRSILLYYQYWVLHGAGSGVSLDVIEQVVDGTINPLVPLKLIILNTDTSSNFDNI